MTIEDSILKFYNEGLTIKEIMFRLENKYSYMDIYHILEKFSLKPHKKKYWFEGNEKEIKRLLDEGKTYKEIGKIFNKNDFHIFTVAKKFGWHSKNKIEISKEEKDNIVNLYKHGFTFNKIEKITGRCDTSISEIIKDAGIIPIVTKIRELNKSLLKYNKRFCPGCQKELELSMFRGRICKECVKENERILYAYKHKISPNLQNVLLHKLKCTKQSAKKRGINFKLTLEDLNNIYLNQNGKCYYTKLSLEIDSTNPHILSVDRINSDLAYTPDNVVLCLKIINIMKNELSIHDFVKYCKLIVNNSKKITTLNGIL